MATKKHLLHVRSNVTLDDGSPKLPTAEDIDYGEIAVNYASGIETLSIKNSENNISTFPNRTMATSTSVNGIQSIGNVCVICEVSDNGTLSISDDMVSGVPLRVIIHNTSGIPKTITMPTDSNYITIGGQTELILSSNGYATLDIISDGETTYISVIDANIYDGNIYNVGDVCMYDITNSKLIIVSYDDWSVDDYPSDSYTPVGVVVIPTSHNVYGTGECAVMSLMAMSCDTPDSGSTSETAMCWGCENLDTELTNYNTVAYTGTCAAPGDGTTVVGTNSYPYLPSDNFSTVQCNADENAYYYSSSSSDYAAPSPYLTDGSKNVAYYATETSDGSAIVNALSDFDGVGNTSVLTELATSQADWKTDETITNTYDSGYYPAACCCWRFCPSGTEQGDWYLPSCGEFGYVIARLKTISNTISSLTSAYDSCGVQLSTSIDYWSSTECSSTDARGLYMYYGYVSSINKNGSTYVRAFLRV